MSLLKYVLSALAVAEGAFAQCSVSATTTVSSVEDASAIASCSTFSGSIALATDAPPSLEFNGDLTTIEGSFEAVNARDVSSLAFNNLQNITMDFHMQNMTSLSNLEMRQLTGCGSLEWQTLPRLNGLMFGNGLSSVKNLSIQDTRIAALDSINLKNASSIIIANNGQLQSISWQLERVVDGITLNSNGPGSNGLNASFPNLERAGYLSISNVSSFTAPSLANCSGTVAIYGSSLEGLVMDNLTQSGGISISNNDQIANVSFERLRTCDGALVVTSNDKLGGVLAFPALRNINGALNVTGSFEGLRMPELRNVVGTSVVRSSEDLGNTCDAFGPQGSLKGDDILQAKAICSSSAKNPNSENGSGTSSGSSGTSSGAASGIGPAPGSAVGLLGVLAAMLGMF